MDRFFAGPEGWGEGRLTLGIEESHHCMRVMRKRRGDLIEVFDGAGRRARGVIEGDDAGGVEVTFAKSDRGPPRLPGIQLVVAVAKGKTMDLVVQKAVELGVDGIQPLLTEHTVVRLEADEGKRKTEKWQRVALESCKQCGQNIVPEVRPAVQWDQWMGERREDERPGLLASLGKGSVPLKEALARLPEDPEGVDLVIGPEGDFSDREIDAAVEGGLQLVSLGPLTLRMETAVLYGLSVMGYELR